ncbi:hypothetical protein ACWDSJ_28410 [Nocardia sp. NPDC003482]
MENNSNPFPLAAAEDVTEPSRIVRYLTDLAQQQSVQDADGFVIYENDLVVRALAAAAAVGRFHSATEVDGALTVLGDTADTFADTARAYGDPALTFFRPDLGKRAAALDAAAARLTEIVTALAAQFQYEISLRAVWAPGREVEVFDYDDDPQGIVIALDPHPTPVDTIEEATRQLAERRFVVIGEWEIRDAEDEEYTAALRFTLGL